MGADVEDIETSAVMAAVVGAGMASATEEDALLLRGCLGAGAGMSLAYTRAGEGCGGCDTEAAFAAAVDATVVATTSVRTCDGVAAVEPARAFACDLWLPARDGCRCGGGGETSLTATAIQ